MELTDEQRLAITEDDDYVALRRHNYSARAVAARYPEGAPARVIQQALGLAIEAEVAQVYDRAAFALLRRADPAGWGIRVQKLKRELLAFVGSLKATDRPLTPKEEQVILVGHRLATLMEGLVAAEPSAE